MILEETLENCMYTVHHIREDKLISLASDFYIIVYQCQLPVDLNKAFPISCKKFAAPCDCGWMMMILVLLLELVSIRKLEGR